MKSDRPRRTRAGKLAVRRNFGSTGAGKGRLRSTKRERKLSARAVLPQTSEAAERGADVLPGDTAEGSVAEGARPNKADPRTAAHGAGERRRTAAAERAKRAADPSDSTASHSGPKGASGKASGRQARPKKANADLAGGNVSAPPGTGTEAEAAPAAAPAVRSRRWRAEYATEQPRSGGKAATKEGSARKKRDRAGIAAKAASDAVRDTAKVAASTGRQPRPAAAVRLANTHSAEPSAGPSAAGGDPQPAKASGGGGAESSRGAMAGISGTTAAVSSPELLSFRRAPDAFALAQEAAEIGAAALREVATARSLPELVQAQLHCGRAASEIWVHQLRIAASIFLVPTDPWWPSPDAFAASLPD
jgi:hypothetical protein